jgi:peptidoglycan/xylan/chitin deacetylase (PgdA/CDA1 family)
MSIRKVFPFLFLMLALLVSACQQLEPAHSQVLASPTPSSQPVATHTVERTPGTPTGDASSIPAVIQSATPDPTVTPAAAAGLDWDQIAGAVYPNDFAPGGGVRLGNGVSMQDPDGTAVFFQLSHLRVFADLDGDGAEDALVFLLVDTGRPGTWFYLYPVLNRAGRPQPGEGYFLGEGVFLRSLSVERGQVTLLMDTIGSEDYACCPKDSQQLTLRLQGRVLMLEETLDLPDRQVGGRPESQPQRLELAPGDAAVQIEAEIGFNQIDSYRLQAGAGTVLTVELESPAEDVVFSIFGEDGGEMLASFLDGTTAWSGVLPVRQDYLVQVVALSGETSYLLSIQLSEPQAGTAAHDDVSEPDGEPEAEERKLVYLTFDDGPSAQWTPRILEVLARYNAHATFFALGDEVEKNPLTTAAVLAAGQGIANHSATHQTFEGITRAGFLREVDLLGTLLDGGDAACLRPPYGAVDAYTRLYAAEVGDRIVLWDIDPQDWRRPGVTTISQNVLQAVEPGDIILLHDGGGDRSQTVLALEIILRELSAQGYTFDAICK